MNMNQAALKESVQQLAEEAFHQRLISGYGDGEYDGEYQIVYKGKPRHLSLEYAQNLLRTLILLNRLREEAVL
ncbi:hypothetical protein H6G89_09015 [Oscillatoria sp. FACHB-1407]|uniref:hypothetical protein n=1 Tax=Oscillatoria sp. FACHB-1407 TaxID=2692847 RepID=UPI0016886D6E|nr:hypothetical protein [Oscillatoria sp. FACHB-1407]MBD2461183.1 hypothetical protein [Oscillatoria sp. FACHB-1407]